MYCTMHDDNIKNICDYFSQGEKDVKRLGVEIEHFVCDKDEKPAPYDVICGLINKVHAECGGEIIYGDGHVVGMLFNDYNITLEPACQLEISINPMDDIAQIESTYAEFLSVWEPRLAQVGYRFINKGLHPLVESGQMHPSEFALIAKKRYEFMNAHFEKTGKYGKYMMRATASTQVSIDYKSEEDAMAKLRLLQILSPLFALICESKSDLAPSGEFKKHLLRTQIWNSVDNERCGYVGGSIGGAYTYKDYAKHIYTKPIICMSDGGNTVFMGDKAAKDYCKCGATLPIGHVSSMFFPNVRLKQYLEIRAADSMSAQKIMGFAALVKGLMYSDKSLEKLTQMFENVTDEAVILAAEEAIFDSGYSAQVYGTVAEELLFSLFEIARDALKSEEIKYLNGLITLPLILLHYQKIVKKDIGAHIKSAKDAKSYIADSTAKYKNRVVRAMYLPKIFTQDEVDFFAGLIKELYEIFGIVMDNFVKDEDYRALFGFDERLKELILRPNVYSSYVPISRIDVFYDEQVGEFKFCEFNTDGASAMNEDRELNIALKLTDAYKEFAKSYEVTTFELFDSWVDTFVEIYEEYAKKYGRPAVPNVAIVDFLDIGTVNEFEIFKQRFMAKGINTVVCDIRDLTFDGKVCKAKDGTPIDAIYRRAVTTDIMKHYDEVTPLLDAVRANSVCLVGDFKTQIVHNKILYKILHMEQTLRLLNSRQRNFIASHVPYTVSLTSELFASNKKLASDVRENKDNWIIKPEDSYGSYGVHAGVEGSEDEWHKFVDECMDKGYILQQFCNPYRTQNIDLTHDNEDDIKWYDTANLTGLFVYDNKLCGLYSRISYDKMISTQYNEMTLPTIVAKPIFGGDK